MINDALQSSKIRLNKPIIGLYDEHVYTIVETTAKNIDNMIVYYSDKVFRTYLNETAAIDMCRIFNHGLNGEGIIIDDYDGTITNYHFYDGDGNDNDSTTGEDSYTYNTQGVYFPGYYVTDNNGNNDDQQVTIVVNPANYKAKKVKRQQVALKAPC